jgi:hypothetical protein
MLKGMDVVRPMRLQGAPAAFYTEGPEPDGRAAMTAVARLG